MRIYLSAAEASAAQYAAELTATLKAHHPHWDILGMGDARCVAAGLTLRISPEGLDLIGGLEVLKSALSVRKKLLALSQDIALVSPDLFIPFDLPGFHTLLLHRIRPSASKVLYFTPPMVYGRKGNRALKLKPYVDRCIVLFPFDLPLYRAAGIPTDYFGHPLTKQIRQATSPNPQKVLLLPGSRSSELRFSLPTFLEVARILHEKAPGLSFHMVFAHAHQEQAARPLLAQAKLPITSSSQNLHAELSDSACALAVSGTATLEAALALVPHIVCYQISRATHFLARRFVLSVHRIALPNLLCERDVVPEYVESRLNPRQLAEALQHLLSSQAEQAKQKEMFQTLSAKLEGEVFEETLKVIEQLLPARSSSIP